MSSEISKEAEEARRRLVELGGRAAQDFGLGRIVGQTLVYLYLWDGDCSLDQIEKNLGLSKAAVSIAVRQLERLGLLRRSWKKGDRRKYYRTVDSIGVALRQGLLALIRSKMEAAATELDQVHELLEEQVRKGKNGELDFLAARVKRAKVLRDRAATLLGNPLLKFFVSAS